jgi:hypothetical protein
MFIVPFIIRDSPPSILQWNLQPISLFLDNRGRALCTTDCPAEWLSINGIIADSTWTHKDVMYAMVNQTKTKLSDFYSFEQLTKSQSKGTEECWRTFYILNEPTWDSFLDTSVVEALGTIQKKCMP